MRCLPVYASPAAAACYDLGNDDQVGAEVKRVLLGLFVLVHGCAHAAIGVWALAEGSPWVVTPLWATAMLGYFATGLGILRVPLLRTWWKQLL